MSALSAFLEIALLANSSVLGSMAGKTPGFIEPIISSIPENSSGNRLFNSSCHASTVLTRITATVFNRSSMPLPSIRLLSPFSSASVTEPAERSLSLISSFKLSSNSSRSVGKSVIRSSALIPRNKISQCTRNWTSVIVLAGAEDQSRCRIPAIRNRPRCTASSIRSEEKLSAVSSMGTHDRMLSQSAAQTQTAFIHNCA